MNQKLSSSFKLKYLNLLLVGIALAYLTYKFNDYHQQNYGQLFIDILTNGNTSLLFVALILIPFNYGIEAKKWQILLSPLQHVSWINAFKSILAGITISIFTPNRTGEVIGKVVYLDLQEKMKAALLNFSGSMAQMICTSLAGLWGTIIYLNFYSFKEIDLPATQVIYAIASICTLLAFLIYFNQQKFFTWISNKKWAKKIHISFTNQQQFKSSLQVKVLVLSIIRYIVFSLNLFYCLIFVAYMQQYFNSFYFAPCSFW